MTKGSIPVLRTFHNVKPNTNAFCANGTFCAHFPIATYAQRADPVCYKNRAGFSPKLAVKTTSDRTVFRVHGTLQISFADSPQIARFLWCMIRLDLCHGASVKRLAAYISEYQVYSTQAYVQNRSITAAKNGPTRVPRRVSTCKGPLYGNHKMAGPCHR